MKGAKNKQKPNNRNQTNQQQDQKPQSSPHANTGHSGLKSMSEKQKEINNELNSIVAEILEDVNQNVNAAQIKTMIDLMKKHYKYFKTSFTTLLDKVLIIEEKDTHIKGVYKLIDRFYLELSKTKAIQARKWISKQICL